MWLYLVGACDISWHFELSESLLTSPGGWWLGSSCSSASGMATNQPIGIGNEDCVKLTHHTLRLLTGWKIVLMQKSCLKQMWASFLGLVLGAKTSYMGL